MKKTVFILALVTGLALVFACKTQPKVAEPATPEDARAEARKKMYDQYGPDLILDGAETYTVQPGDSLVHIAQAKYGQVDGGWKHAGFDYPLIMLATNMIIDPDKIEPGMELSIPDLRRNLDNPGAKAALGKLLEGFAAIEEEHGRHDTAEGMRARAAELENSAEE